MLQQSQQQSNGAQSLHDFDIERATLVLLKGAVPSRPTCCAMTRSLLREEESPKAVAWVHGILTTLMVRRRSSSEALAGSVTPCKAVWNTCWSCVGCLLLSRASSSLGPASGLLNRADAELSAHQAICSRGIRLSCSAVARFPYIP